MNSIKWMHVFVRRDASTTSAVAVAEHELPLLQHLYGAESVEAGAREIDGHGEYACEYDRLARKYGEETVLSVYGKAHSGRLEAAIAAAQKAAKPSEAEDAAKTAKGK